MDVTTIVGLLCGIGILIGALSLGQIPIANLLHPEALLIVFGGTFAAVLISFSAKELMGALTRGLGLALTRPHSSHQDCADYMADIATFVRQQGALSLQPVMDRVELPFVRKGLAMIVDNLAQSQIRYTLSREIDREWEKTCGYARVFESAGGFSPTMGIIGAVIGLIQVVGAFEDPGELALGVAGAFSATLYGVALANLFVLPLAEKIRQRAREHRFQQMLLLEGILSIHAGEHPRITAEKLQSFVGGFEADSGPRQDARQATRYRRAPGPTSGQPSREPHQANTEELLDDIFEQPALR